MGYDISDYEDIHAAYGTLQDCNHLIKEIHDRGMRVIFDLVINHTSDQHEWFKESRSSKTNPKRDWYIWRPARIDENGNRCRPNSWRSNFSIPAWTWDETTQEYYLHLFASEQPDLNWENEQCRNAIYDSSIKFWLERGVDGFRVGKNRLSLAVSCPMTNEEQIPSICTPRHTSTIQRQRYGIFRMHQLLHLILCIVMAQE